MDSIFEMKEKKNLCELIRISTEALNFRRSGIAISTGLFTPHSIERTELRLLQIDCTELCRTVQERTGSGLPTRRLCVDDVSENDSNAETCGNVHTHYTDTSIPKRAYRNG